MHNAVRLLSHVECTLPVYHTKWHTHTQKKKNIRNYPKHASALHIAKAAGGQPFLVCWPVEDPKRPMRRRRCRAPPEAKVLWHISAAPWSSSRKLRRWADGGLCPKKVHVSGIVHYGRRFTIKKPLKKKLKPLIPKKHVFRCQNQSQFRMQRN